MDNNDNKVCFLGFGEWPEKHILLHPLSRLCSQGKRLFLSLLLLIGLAWLSGYGQAAAEAPSPARRTALIEMVRQDCGSCHGLKLTGGLGPALTPEALRGKPGEGLAATIYHGRPGTAMPGWKPFLSEAEAHWIAETLMAGFPDVPR